MACFRPFLFTNLAFVSVLAFLLLHFMSYTTHSRRISTEEYGRRVFSMEHPYFQSLEAKTQALVADCLSERVITRGRNAEYTNKLIRAIELEIEQLERSGDEEYRAWKVDSYKDVSDQKGKVLFRKCRHCRTNYRVKDINNRVVTKYELLIPIQDTCKGGNSHRGILLKLGEIILKPSRGTVRMPSDKIVIFDLGGPESLNALTTDTGLEATVLVSNPSCITAKVHRATLFEYCNMSTMALDRLWGHNLREDHKASPDFCDRLLDEVTSKQVFHPLDMSRRKRSANVIVSEIKELMYQYSDSDKIFTSDEQNSTHSSPSYKTKRSVEKSRFRRAVKSPSQIHHIRISGTDCRNYADLLSQLMSYKDILKSKSRTPCNRLDFYINLHYDVRYTDFETPFPNRCVNVGICAGSCAAHQFFDSISEGGTGHAVLFNKLKQASEIAKTFNFGTHHVPSGCRSNRMKSIPVLMMPRDGDRSLGIKVVPDLVIESCRCA